MVSVLIFNLMNKTFFYKLNYLLTDEDKRKLFILLIMSIFLSLIEVVGISAIMPFISTASSPELIFTNEYYRVFYDILKLSSSEEFIIYLGSILIFFYIFRGVYTVFHGYLIIKFSMEKYSDFANKLFENYVNIPYSEFVNRNSSTMSKVIITEASQLSSLVQSVLAFLSESIIIVIIYILLLMVDVKMTVILTIFLGLKIILLNLTISKKIKVKGSQRAVIQDKRYRAINEMLENFKVLKFISNQSKFLNRFIGINVSYSNVHVTNNTLQLVPRSVLEAVGLSMLMSIVIYIVVYENNIVNVIPIISMYALALYRILPAITRIINNYNMIVFYVPSLDIVYDDISYQYEKEGSDSVDFNHTIYIKDVSFSYNSKSVVLDNFSLQIEKGKRIAFVGASGSGKSTLVDLICGIYRPEKGKILIDGVELDNSNIVSWRKRIGYIPQDIYLFDGTIADNIVFGRDYDEDKLTKVLKQSNIYDFIIQKDGFDTMVGEGGMQLSGGQKQRIGIARALYGDPEILVLDEATSALDTKTEKAIMNEIYSLSEGKTLMIIAHRLSTIEECDMKVDVSHVAAD